MVLILDRRLNHENSGGVPEPPAIKRKVFELESKTLSDVYNFSSGSSHSESVLQVFNEFRDSRLFTDVIISVQGREFPCHRAVLSACSSYFRAMFCNDHRESREMLVEINGIQADAMDTFLQYVYTGRACITTHNVQFLFETSSLFQINALRDACAKFLEEQLDPCNCLGIQRFADAHSLKQLASRCRAFALLNFPEVAQHEEFLDLHKDELQEYLASDELSIGREEVVFEAVMRWVYHGVEYRRPMLKDLLQHVRLPLLHPNYFVQTVEGDKLIQNAPECYQLLHEARRYHVLGNEMMSPRTRPRRSTGFSEVIVVVGGCERMGGFNLPYTECYDPVTGEWTSLAKHPEYTKSEYAVCALRNDIIVSVELRLTNSVVVWMGWTN
uniref:Kelch-like family member 24a n=1 Tax=Cyprinus carpio TaxID=7962 RepID=A0A8C1W262_CYPCA